MWLMVPAIYLIEKEPERSKDIFQKIVLSVQSYSDDNMRKKYMYPPFLPE